MAERHKRFKLFGPILAAAVIAVAVAYWASPSSAETTRMVPPPTVDETSPASLSEVAVLAGGCFWGVQGVFQHVDGVTAAVSGYAGGARDTAKYPTVSTGDTGHAESVQITFDPHRISYGRLLQIYFSVAHDPTQRNRQGPDTGTQYRSIIFYTTAEQKQIPESYIPQLEKQKTFPGSILTQVGPLKAFYKAEDYHQNYATLHPDNPYIAINDAPKVEHLQQQ